MKRYIVIVLVFLFSIFLCFLTSHAQDTGEDAFPDLLGEDYDEVLAVPDLLADEPGSPGVDRDDAADFFVEVPYEGVVELEVYDPLEPVNRVLFEFNDKLYFWVLKPVKSVYSQILPWDIRYCIGNFFTNIAAPVRLVNNLLQGEFEDAGAVAGRFVINTIFGIAGLGDPAYRDFGIEPRGADFGQTLGKWGIGEGIYFFWPGLGPSTLRDTLGIVGDVYLHPVQYMYDDFLGQAVYFGVDKMNVLSLSPDVYEELKRISLDPYVASREAYYEYRRAVIEKK